MCSGILSETELPANQVLQRSGCFGNAHHYIVILDVVGGTKIHKLSVFMILLEESTCFTMHKVKHL